MSELGAPNRPQDVQRPGEQLVAYPSPDLGSAQIAIAHDYLTQRGGAERVVLDISAAFPGSPVYTSLFHPNGTFPEFNTLEPRTSVINRLRPLRVHHRLALPLLAPAVSMMRIEADVAVISSSGWAHGMRTSGRKVVYCHAPARWLYQTDTYLGERPDAVRSKAAARRWAAATVLRTVAPSLRRWDRRAASVADVYLANSNVTRKAVYAAYGIEAEVLPPPPALGPHGVQRAPEGIDPGFFLCVARLLPYKNVDSIIRAVHRIEGARLVVVGVGPDAARLASLITELEAGERAAARIRQFGRATDEELRWLYSNCQALVAASIEDYGLTPLEAASFGKPTVALARGGYLETVIDGVTGVMFGDTHPEGIAAALLASTERQWNATVLESHAQTFGRDRFQQRLRQVVADVLQR